MPAAVRRPVHRRDDRYGALDHREGHLLEDRVLALPVRVRHPVALLEVAPRAERPLALAGQDDAPDVPRRDT